MSRLAALVTMVFVAVAFLALTWVYAAIGVDWTAYVSTVIALVSLETSLVALFKQELFPFRLEIVATDLILAATDPAYPTPTVALPITFINRSYSDGVVESICVLVTEHGAHTKAYFPKGEFDMSDFIAAKRVVYLSRLKTLLYPFPVDAQQSVFKNILFVQPEGRKDYSATLWAAGVHKFEVQVKAARWNQFRKLAELQFDIPNDHLVAYYMGQSSEYRGSDPAILDLYASTRATPSDS